MAHPLSNRTNAGAVVRPYIDPEKKHAAGSEQISLKWVEGAKRECRRCGVKITNLSKQVGEVRSVYPGPRRDLLCSDCHHARRS